ncbi:hypothetical protein PG993_010481 [Apiospora rasikravindrae]|uniref:Uncharacterized protein n=1 Tax=Apiospora rasikravindrae TaxID=990691 RepID=A0ABR1SMG0_9PEZI
MSRNRRTVIGDRGAAAGTADPTHGMGCLSGWSHGRAGNRVSTSIDQPAGGLYANPATLSATTIYLQYRRQWRYLKIA